MRRHHLYLIAVAFIAQAPSADALPRAGDLQALGGHSAIQEIAVIGKDTRRRVPKRLRKATRGIGLITDTAAKRSCTAFCIGKDAIATSNHCIAWRERKKSIRTRNLRRFTFRLGRKSTRLRWHNVRPIGNPYLSVLANWPRKKRSFITVEDWTAARLAKPVCAGKVLKLASDNLVRLIARSSDMRLAMIGFHKGRGKRRLTYSSCYLAEFRQGVGNARFVHSCDSTPRSSGSPIVYDRGSHLEVVGINRGWLPIKKRRSFQFGNRRTKPLRFVNVGTAVIELRWKLARFLDMEFIEKPTTVRKLQTQLQLKGFFKGKIDGRVSPELTRVIETYQYSRGDVPLGIPTRKMLLDLKAQ